MNIPRIALQRVLYTPALNPLAQTALQCSLRRPPSILRLAIRNASSTTVQEQTPQPVVQPAKAEQTTQEAIGNKSSPPLDGVKEAVRKVSKRVARKDKTEEFTPNPSPAEAHAESRTIKNAEKQRRNQEDNSRPQKSRAQKSLRRVGSDASLPREVLEGIIQQAETKTVRAHCVSESFSFPKLRAILGNHGYYPFTALSEDCIHVTSDVANTTLPTSEKGDIFFFINGTVVTWGLTEEDNLRLLDHLKPAQIEPYRDIEEEELDYIQDEQLRTGVMGDTVLLGPDEDLIYAKLAFSNGIARSTKLAVLEEQLDNYLDSTREIPRILARGKKLPWGRAKTMQKVGELLAFRGELNLHSELVETPDLYWARPQLEEYYNRISKRLDVVLRITLLNQKLDYANELAAFLRSHLSEKHSLALEWGIIGLIAIEVVFGVIHLVQG